MKCSGCPVKFRRPVGFKGPMLCSSCARKHKLNLPTPNELRFEFARAAAILDDRPMPAPYVPFKPPRKVYSARYRTKRYVRW